MTRIRSLGRAVGLAPAYLFVLLAASSPAIAAGPDGAAIYGKRCAGCHDQTVARIPPRSALQKLSPARILRTLDFGAMMAIAYPITREDREAVAGFLGKGADDPPPPANAFCATDRHIMAAP